MILDTVVRSTLFSFFFHFLKCHCFRLCKIHYRFLVTFDGNGVFHFRSDLFYHWAKHISFTVLRFDPCFENTFVPNTTFFLTIAQNAFFFAFVLKKHSWFSFSPLSNTHFFLPLFWAKYHCFHQKINRHRQQKESERFNKRSWSWKLPGQLQVPPNAAST